VPLTGEGRSVAGTVLTMTVRPFDLVPVDTADSLDLSRWSLVESCLGEFQPAQRIEPVGDPPRAIRVWSEGEPEVAPGILRRVEWLVGVSLRIDPTASA
jgi:hypothetical protein